MLDWVFFFLGGGGVDWFEISCRLLPTNPLPALLALGFWYIVIDLSRGSSSNTETGKLICKTAIISTIHCCVRLTNSPFSSLSCALVLKAVAFPPSSIDGAKQLFHAVYFALLAKRRQHQRHGERRNIIGWNQSWEIWLTGAAWLEANDGRNNGLRHR